MDQIARRAMKREKQRAKTEERRKCERQREKGFDISFFDFGGVFFYLFKIIVLFSWLLSLPTQGSLLIRCEVYASHSVRVLPPFVFPFFVPRFHFKLRFCRYRVGLRVGKVGVTIQQLATHYTFRRRVVGVLRSFVWVQLGFIWVVVLCIVFIPHREWLQAQYYCQHKYSINLFIYLFLLKITD